MIRLYDISLPQGRDLPSYIQNKYGKVSFSIYRRSIDARRGRPLRTVYTVDIMTECQDELVSRFKGEKYELLSEEGYVCPQKSGFDCRPVVVGFGPAGMFAALLLAKAGARPIVLERGKSVDERVKSVELFWNTGILDPESNVQFGEGGAGSFSDGKLNTLVKDKNYRGRFVLSTFVSHGAPEDIMYDAKPHIGTDLLRGCVKGIREEIISLGGEVIFGARMTDILVSGNCVSAVKYVKNGEENVLKTDSLFLGIGHSARDTFRMLAEKHIIMEAKPFSVGVRIEHPRKMIDDSQYREHAPFLPAASYKLSHHTGTGRGVYTFCMCPGG
ncbi:MAG: FAD-dependent oxidoreductase, partial [Clostridia bacterium]|nr:FAD-dependent oxidoreductase [Clostridia bacterium]